MQREWQVRLPWQPGQEVDQVVGKPVMIGDKKIGTVQSARLTDDQMLAIVILEDGVQVLSDRRINAVGFEKLP